MDTRVSLDWHGGEMTAKVIRALKIGIDKTTSDASIEAKRLVNIDTSTLQGSIRPEAAAENSNGQIVGIYGPHDVEYAAWQEFLPGEQMPDGATRERSGGKPYMRPSMAKAEEEIGKNIRDAYEAQR